MLEKISQTVKSATGWEDAKIADLQPNMVEADKHTQTTDYGAGIPDPDNTVSVSSKTQTGPQLLEDHIARERINHFDHERIPERVVHARGSGAFGNFTLLESAEDVTYAGVLTDTSRTTPVFVRFSTVLGSRGSADSVRDVRGFATKFYTEEGNWDLVGNNIPVFFINDAIKFVDVIHAGKPEPHNEIPQAQSAHDNFWDFQFLHPEATHMFMWAMSDRAIPRSYRMMQGFGVNTYSLVNKKGERSFVKFHWKPDLGVHSLVWDEALKIAGQDPDYHRRDLWEAIDNKAFPTWKFGIQVLPEAQEHDFEFDILDDTKVWPEELIPIRWIGQLELNRNPDEFFTETEQVAFCTSHIVPGIDFSNDPVLQGRNFSYLDTQISRIGVNFQQLPINRPVCPVFNHHSRDGAMQTRIHKGTVNYWPNRFDAGPPTPVSKGGLQSYPEKIAGIKARIKSDKFQEHYNQAQMFYNSLSAHEKTHVEKALAFELARCVDPIVYNRMSKRLADIDLALAQKVATMVGGEVPQSGRENKLQKASGLSQTEFPPAKPTIASRRIGIIIADGFNYAEVSAAIAAISASAALPYVIGPRRAPIKASNGSTIPCNQHLESFRSTLVDALLLPGGEHVPTLLKSGRAIHWIREAFGHCKAIGATGNGIELLNKALGDEVREKVAIASIDATEAKSSYAVVTGGKLPEAKLENLVSIAKEGKDFIEQYFYAVANHRCFERESDGLVDLVAF